jgi:hypothetical protein
MVEEHYCEFELLNAAVKACNNNLHPANRDKVRLWWMHKFNTWVGSNQAGLCPFHTIESKSRTHDFMWLTNCLAD